SAMWKTVTPIKPSAMAGVRRDIGASLRVGHSCHGLGPWESRSKFCASPKNMGISNHHPVGQDQTVRFFDTTLAPRATLELSATSVRYPQTARELFSSQCTPKRHLPNRVIGPALAEIGAGIINARPNRVSKFSAEFLLTGEN